MNIIPLRALVLVELEDVPAQVEGGLIHVVRAEREPSCFARVVAVGPEVREPALKPGAPCVVSRLQGIEIAGKVLLPESAILEA